MVQVGNIKMSFEISKLTLINLKNESKNNSNTSTNYSSRKDFTPKTFLQK